MKQLMTTMTLVMSILGLTSGCGSASNETASTVKDEAREVSEYRGVREGIAYTAVHNNDGTVDMWRTEEPNNRHTYYFYQALRCLGCPIEYADVSLDSGIEPRFIIGLYNQEIDPRGYGRIGFLRWNQPAQPADNAADEFRGERSGISYTAVRNAGSSIDMWRTNDPSNRHTYYHYRSLRCLGCPIEYADVRADSGLEPRFIVGLYPESREIGFIRWNGVDLWN